MEAAQESIIGDEAARTRQRAGDAEKRLLVTHAGVLTFNFPMINTMRISYSQQVKIKVFSTSRDVECAESSGEKFVSYFQQVRKKVSVFRK